MKKDLKITKINKNLKLEILAKNESKNIIQNYIESSKIFYSFFDIDLNEAIYDDKSSTLTIELRASKKHKLMKI